MIKIIVILVCLLIAILFGYHLESIQGRVIIDLSGTIIQLSLLGSFIVFLLSFAVAVVAFWLIRKLIRAVSGSRTWLGAFSSRSQQKAFYASINAMLMNESQQARKLIAKTVNGDFKGSNYLIAAELESQAGNSEQAQAYLIQAMDYPDAEPLAIMKQAELKLSANQAEEAMNLLSNIEGKIRNSKAFVMLKLNILQGLSDWPQIESLAKENKKLLGDDYVVWASQWTQGEFSAIASKHGANALKQHWQELSRAERKDVANQVSYIKLLIEQGQSAEAEKELLNFASKRKYQGYWDLFKQLNHANPVKAMNFIEHEIKKSPDDAELYSVLANLAYNTNDIELAHKAINKAVELHDSPLDKALLAAILEKKSEFQQANTLYKGLLK
jgi:HemY protein